MQQFILEEHLNIIVSESVCQLEEIMHLDWDEIIGIMLRIHQTNLRHWRSMVKMQKWENPTSLHQVLSDIWKRFHIMSQRIGCLRKK